MSDAGGGAAPAQISVTTDYETFRQFIKDAVSGFEEVESRGSKLTKSLKQGFLDFGKAAVREALKPVREAADVVLEPLQTSIRQATQEARVWRKENTTIAAAMGKDWRTIGRDVDEVATRTRRPTEELRHYLEAQGKLTGNWDTAKEAVGTYSKLASYSGKRSVEELAPLAAKLETTFGIKGQERVEEFWRGIITGAERAGQGGARAVSFMEFVAANKPLTIAKEKGGQFAQEAQQARNALIKKGYSAEQAESVVGSMIQEMSGNVRNKERFMRATGVLGKNESLYNKDGIANFGLIEWFNKTREAELRRAGGSRKVLRARMMQDQNNLGNPLYGAALSDPDILPRAIGREQAADSGIDWRNGGMLPRDQLPNPLSRSDEYRQYSEEGERADSEQRKRREDRDMGSTALGAQDWVAARAPGGGKGVAANAAASLFNPLNASNPMEALIRGGLGAVAGGVAYATGALDGPSKASTPAANQQLARDIGAAVEQGLRKQPLNVRLEVSPPPPSGGMQTQ